MRRSRDPVGSWTPLVVDDVVRAATYYREALGCQQVALLGGTPPRLAILRGFGTTLLLQERPTTDHEQEGLGGPPWDAVVAVPDVRTTHAELAKRGVAGLTDMSEAFQWQFFEFRDPSGNLVCIGESLAPSKSWRPPGGNVLTRTRARVQSARTDREEREHLREFQAFYENLEDKRDVFYMFFTSGLLHWVMRSVSFVPADVNLVLIGSALSDEEQQWVKDHLRRPFHHIDIPVDDITVWDFLFATSEENFGWLDIDCFVLDSELFTEMAAVPPDRSLNCIWAAETGYGFSTAATHFLFMNVDAIKAVAARGARPSACTYDWAGSLRLFPQRKCYTRVPTTTERRLLLQSLPADEKGRPHFLNDSTFYETMAVYQLLARAVGYPIHQVRDLVRRCRVPWAALSEATTDPELWPEDVSDDVFHLNAISHYRDHEHGPHIYVLYRAAELAMLADVADTLPASYAAHRDTLVEEFAGAGEEPDSAKDVFRRHMITCRGLSEQAADRVLDEVRGGVGSR